MVDLTPFEGQELSVEVLDLQTLSTPSALAADELGALGKKSYSSHDCDDGDKNVAVACALITTLLSIL